jgi:uncharacterized membrane protein YcjF (UPF0283 family)
MFSFRSDKTGFFVTIIMLVLLGLAVVGTLVVLVLGRWNAQVWILKWVWGAWWVLCIITVLARLAIFRWQMMRAARNAQAQQPKEQVPQDQQTSSRSRPLQDT